MACQNSLEHSLVLFETKQITAETNIALFIDKWFWLLPFQRDRLVGLVGKASVSGAEDTDSTVGIFPDRVIPMT